MKNGTCAAAVLAMALAVPSLARAETIAYWPFGENGFHDVSGNGHDLVGTNIAESDAAYVVLNQGSTMNQLLKTASAIDLSGESAVTFELWFRRPKSRTVTWGVPRLMCSATPSNLGGFEIDTYTTDIQAQYKHNTGDGWQFDTYNSFDDNTTNMWHHLAYVVDTNEVNITLQCRLYVDGVLVTGTSSSTQIPPLFNDVFVIGGDISNTQYAWRGYIDDVRISRGALTPSEFLKYPTPGKKMRADTATLPVIAHWPFGAKKGEDVTGNGFDLTMDDTVPMTNGTPNMTLASQDKFVNFRCENIPLSTLSLSGFTLECYARSDGLRAYGSNILTLSPDRYFYNHAGAFRLGHDDSGHPDVMFRQKDSNRYASSKKTTSTIGSDWIHLAVIYDPSVKGPGMVKLYVNGTVADEMTFDEGSTTNAIPLQDAILHFSRPRDSEKYNSEYYGQFDDVRITAGVLMPSQFLPPRMDGETIAYWPFGTNGVNDVSGNGHTLSEVNITIGTAGCASLNSGRTDQYLVTASQLDLSREQKVTFECWWKALDCPANAASVLMASKYPLSGTGGFVVCNQNAGVINGVGYRRIHAGYCVDESAPLEDEGKWQIELSDDHADNFVDGKWHHIAYVVDTANFTSNSCLLYIDGEEQNGDPYNKSCIPALFNDYFTIGGCPDFVASERSAWHGYIDDVRISRGVLSTNDFLLAKCPYPSVGKTMNSETPPSDDVIAYWKFGSDNPGRDSTGNGFDLTMDGTIPFVAGTPRNGYWESRFAYTNFYCESFPLSAFSKKGVTIEFYARSDSSPDDSGDALAMTNSAGPGSFRIGYEGGFRTAGAHFCTAAGALAESVTTEADFGALNDGNWRHFAVVYDPSKTGAGIVTLYVDGVAADASATSAGQGAFDLADGRLYFMPSVHIGVEGGGVAGYTRPFYGRIDDVRITAGAKSADKFLSKRTRTDTTSTTTKALYRFDNSTLVDQSGHGTTLVNNGGATFSDKGRWPESGTGLLLNGSSQWLATSAALDLSSATGMTVEVDFCSDRPPPGDDGINGYRQIASSEDPYKTGENAFVVYRQNDILQAQVCNKNTRNWDIQGHNDILSTNASFHGARFVMDNLFAPDLMTKLIANGTNSVVLKANGVNAVLPNQKFVFGHCANYLENRWLDGKFLRIAITAEALDDGDFVLDNIIERITQAKTLANFDFSHFLPAFDSGLSVGGFRPWSGAARFYGGNTVVTTNLHLDVLSQMTIECYVNFGTSPSSGEVFRLGDGVTRGSVVVVADAAADTLTGKFMPFNAAGTGARAGFNGSVIGLSPLVDGRWHHVAMVCDRLQTDKGAAALYVDWGRAPSSCRSFARTVRFAPGGITLGGGGFNGMIDDLRVTAGCRSPSSFNHDPRTSLPNGLRTSFR